MEVAVTVESKIAPTFRVEQISGMFGVRFAEKIGETFRVELPGLDEEWRIGCIVGPSGSGKSTIAREAYGENLVETYDWPRGKAVIDGFPEALEVKDITQALSSVGFSSPPSWAKPYSALSNGERFRANLARALLEKRDVTAFDEFTSVVDRTVAKIGSAAVSKAIRKGRFPGRFVAVTCHYDVVDWLQPDWVLDMASQQLARGCLRPRPEIPITIAPVHRSAWSLFQRHHYLDHAIALAARCFCAFWEDTPIAFNSWIPNVISGSLRATWRGHRTVVLPDYQGIGIGGIIADVIASAIVALGMRAIRTTSHPAVIAALSRSANWNRKRLNHASGERRPNMVKAGSRNSRGRVTGGFEYVGPAMDPAFARVLWDSRAIPFGDPLIGQILELVRERPGVSTRYLRRLSGLPSEAVRKRVDAAVRAGALVVEGKGKTLGLRIAEGW